MAKVVAVNISERKGVVKKPVDQIKLIEEHGIESDAHAGKWHRQVSFLAVESIDKMKKQGIDHLDYGVFAENITTEGIELYTLPVGTKLKVGETLLEITQIGKECHHGCEIRQLVGDCVMPREGIFGIVLKGGIVKADDEITIVE
ncbi:MOSC domain-containing protein [Clostridium cylindrosporum]|uniref:MOSC domain containing protein n=1 Tax=Clostridium cylindrosporum DSM 605 TaxID=1121307 RepID=A0A0J8G4U2_CLOCY|nr:MOSC domain-containing protein [Clostridium cylindrosporum]KMT22696.1 MOSC domain containing protein [Clostridium cylindrosporum DSM 605]